MGIQPFVQVGQKEVRFGFVEVDGDLTNGVGTVDQGQHLLFTQKSRTAFPVNRKETAVLNDFD